MSKRVVTLTAPPTVRPPAGLSTWAQTTWITLIAIHDFEQHELVVFERALRWWDKSDTAAQQALGTTDAAEASRCLTLAMNASTAALRHWRTLKFPNPEGVRRPGRPSGPDWSSKRKAAAS